MAYGYQQHLADATRLDRESLPFEKWAVLRTWPRFVNLARFCTVIPECGWPMRSGEPTSSHAYGSVVLARALLDAPILVKAALTYVYKRSHRSHSAVREHIDRGKVYPGNERALGKGKRLVYDYLRQVAKTEEVLCR